MTESRGFTLLEVMVAVLVVALSFGILLSWVSQNLRAVGASRLESEAARLAEQRAREIQAELNTGVWVGDGTDRGTFDEPHDNIAWEVEVEPFEIPLPEGVKAKDAPSPMFAGAGPSSDEGGVLKRVRIRVLAIEDERELVDPYLLIAVQMGAPPGDDPGLDEELAPEPEPEP